MIGALITLIVYLLVIGLLLWLVYYVIDAIPIPDPPARFIKLAIVVLAVLVVIVLILQVFGGANLNLPKLG